MSNLELAQGSDKDDRGPMGEIGAIVHGATGRDCSVNLVVVPELDPLPSGKYLSVISKAGLSHAAHKTDRAVAGS